MPSTVSSLLSSVGLEPGGSVPWGTPVPETASGVYLVSLTASPADNTPRRDNAPLSKNAFAELAAACPNMTLDGAPDPTPHQIAERIGSYWLPDECVLYIGLAGQPLRSRVRQYYNTPLGAEKPHKGGWWLKALSVLEDLHVHYARTSDFKAAEELMMRTFATHVSPTSLARWPAGEPVMPFANLRDGDWRRRNHRIRGATAGIPTEGPSAAPQSDAPNGARSATDSVSTTDPVASHSSRSPYRSQNVTAKDIEVGQVRIPRIAKAAFPQERGDVIVRIRGLELTCRWDPRNGPPGRSGVIRIGKVAAAELLTAGDVLIVIGREDSVVELD